MKKVLVPLADGFEEIETVTIIDILRRAGVEVTVAGIKPGTLAGSRNIKLVPDTTLDKVQDQEFDAVVLPGGQPGVNNLRKDSRVLEVVRRFYEKKKLVGAICAAPLVLRDAGLIKGVKLTSYPGVASELTNSKYETTRVVIDGNFITSRAPGTALEFSLKLVELLIGKNKAEEVSEMVLAKKS